VVVVEEVEVEEEVEMTADETLVTTDAIPATIDAEHRPLMTDRDTEPILTNETRTMLPHSDEKNDMEDKIVIVVGDRPVGEDGILTIVDPEVTRDTLTIWD